jgi:hypothetical protein
LSSSDSSDDIVLQDMSVVPAPVSVPALQKAASTSSLVASTESHDQAGHESTKSPSSLVQASEVSQDQAESSIQWKSDGNDDVGNDSLSPPRTKEIAIGLLAAAALLILILLLLWWKRKRNGLAKDKEMNVFKSSSRPSESKMMHATTPQSRVIEEAPEYFLELFKSF